MATPIGKQAINGIYLGGAIAVAPLAITVLLVGKNLIETVLVGLLAKIMTDGKYNTAFNVIVTSPKFWNVMRTSALIGSAVSTVSFLGFCFAEQRMPERRDFYAF